MELPEDTSLTEVLTAYAAIHAHSLYSEIDPDGLADTPRELREAAFKAFSETVAVEDLEFAVVALAIANSDELAKTVLDNY